MSPAKKNAERPHGGVSVDAATVLKRALKANMPTTFNSCWTAGYTKNHPSDSDRDLALCNHLIFYCGNVPNDEKLRVVDEIIRDNSLFRDKWDEVHRPEDGVTYGRMTIEKAVGGVKDCYREKTETKTDSRNGKKVLTLDDFTLNGMSQRMKKKMLEDKFVLSRLAILGQMTIFYAGPNTGKTLLTLWMIIEKINAREINGSDIYYINANDTFKGLTYKTHLAEKHGFKMIGVGHKHDDAEERFEPKMLVPILESMIENGTASGVVVVLDTAKKFTDLMDKKTTSEFAAAFREFVSHGGTGIFMAHINKHRDGDDKPVHSGTTDLIDDSDCAYIIDTISEDPATGIKTMRFENKKNRGDVLREESFQYDCRTDTSYNGKLSSIKRLDDDDASEVEVMARLSKKFENDREVVEAIKDCIKEGIIQKTSLIDEAVKRLGATKPPASKGSLKITPDGRPTASSFGT